MSETRKTLNLRVLYGRPLTLKIPGLPPVEITATGTRHNAVVLQILAPAEVQMVREDATVKTPALPRAKAPENHQRGACIVWRRTPDDPGGKVLGSCADLTDALAVFDNLRLAAEAEYRGEGHLLILNAAGHVCWEEKIRRYPAVLVPGSAVRQSGFG